MDQMHITKLQTWS